MLTKALRDMVERKNILQEKLDPKERKYINFTLRRYVEKHLNSLSDLLQVLDALPKNQIEPIISSSQIIDLLKIQERLMRILPPVEIIKDEANSDQAIRRFALDFGSNSSGTDDTIKWIQVLCPASNDEIEYWRMFLFQLNYLAKIRDDIRNNPPNYTSIEFNREILPKLNSIAELRNASCKVETLKKMSEKSYLDFRKGPSIKENTN